MAANNSLDFNGDPINRIDKLAIRGRKSNQAERRITTPQKAAQKLHGARRRANAQLQGDRRRLCPGQERDAVLVRHLRQAG